MGYDILPTSNEFRGTHISFWQSSLWRDILIRSSQVREVFYFGDEQRSLLVEIRSIGGGQVAAFSLGVSSLQSGFFSETAFLAGLSRLLRDRKCLWYQIEPISEHTAMEPIPKIGYRAFLTPHTRILDLSLSEEGILAQMHEKGRYNIRLAQKRGVTVESVVGNQENIDTWMSLLVDTTQRDHFSHNSRAYYESFISEVEKQNMGGLLFAYYQGRVIAAIIVVYTIERAIYYYGASVSDRDLRKHMAPYLLQWHALCEAKQRGILLYDFLGVADPDNLDDPLQSVSEFKEKFGGRMLRLAPKKIIPLSLKGQFFLFFRNLFRA